MSSSKLEPMFMNVRSKYPIIEKMANNSNPYLKNIQNFDSENDEKVFNMFLSRRRFIRCVNSIRNEYRVSGEKCIDFARNILNQLKHTRCGNCFEDANAAEVIMKVNGVKNACTATLKAGEYNIDHVVCLFNRDGSEVGGKVSKNTIVIDPWLGVVDFAKNVFKKYKSMYKNFIYIPENNEGIELRNLSKIKLNKLEIEYLKRKYPEIVFKSDKRDFMK